MLIVTAAALLSGCASQEPWSDPGLSFEPREFKRAIRARVPNADASLTRAPFSLARKTRLLTRDRIASAAVGSNPLRELLALLSEPQPDGFGLEYDWSVTANAQDTLALGRGDCVALAMVLVGMGRSMDWPVYFAEARTDVPIAHEFEEFTVLSGHMVVVALTQQGRVVVDFLGLVEDQDYEIRPLDDLTAYAHLLNNVAGHQVLDTQSGSASERWEVARQGFKLATEIQPELGRAWNNLGIAYARLGRLEEARAAYHRAVELDTVFWFSGTQSHDHGNQSPRGQVAT